MRTSSSSSTIAEEAGIRELSSSSSSSHHYHRSTNVSITTSVTIRVTPHDDYLVSWGVLWSLFVVVSLIAGIQAWKEQKVMAERRRHADDVEIAATKARTTAATTTTIPTSASQTVLAVAAAAVPTTRKQPSTAAAGGGDGEGGVSSADVTRGLFRRLLLLAMISRVAMMPIQVWSGPVWWQFVGDTLPEMVYASAWTLFVTFVVQLVGIATGTGSNTTPGIVIQASFYVAYVVLVITQVRNHVATVLLYALMCCIYSALLGTVSFYCPRLLSLMRPSLQAGGQQEEGRQFRGVTIRLALATCLCMFVFLAHTIGYGRLVINPPREVYWWWKYGVLELLPSTAFVLMMGPVSKKTDRSSDSPDVQGGGGGGRASSAASHAQYHSKTTLRRSESASSANSSGNRRTQHSAAAAAAETTSFLSKGGGASSSTPPPTPPPPTYGSTVTNTNVSSSTTAL